MVGRGSHPYLTNCLPIPSPALSALNFGDHGVHEVPAGIPAVFPCQLSHLHSSEDHYCYRIANSAANQRPTAASTVSVPPGVRRMMMREASVGIRAQPSPAPFRKGKEASKTSC